MRAYLTTLLWHQDQLSSLSSSYLVAVAALCLTILSGLGFGLFRFLEDLAFLLVENELGMALIALNVLLVGSAALWVLSCCAWALARRVLLYLRGL